MALFNLEEITSYVTGGGETPKSNTSAGAVIGATAGSIIPGLGNLIGGTLGTLIGSIRSATPRLDWNQRDSIARPLAGKISDELVKAGYYSNPDFISIFKQKAGQFIVNTNPGEYRSRPEFVNQIAPLDHAPIWLALMWSFQGVSTMPDDPFGIQKRVEQFLNGLLIPAIKEYEQSKGIKSSVVSSFTVQPNGSIDQSTVSPFALGLGAVALGLVVFGMVKMK